MQIDEQVQYWLEGAKHDLEAAEHLLRSGDHSWCLFIAHLVLEKMLKAKYARDTGEAPPRTHNLLSLALKTRLVLDDERQRFLFVVGEFNIEARYPDYRQSFYKRCTREFAAEQFDKIKEFREWVLPQI